MARKFRLGVDIGGTFTDLVLLGEDGSVRTLKIPSTPEDYGEAIVEGACRILANAGLSADHLAEIVHATTIVTNTVLEGKGANTALVTTKGFRDVLAMRRLRIPEMYDLQYRKPPPLVPRRLSFEVDERMGPDGTVWRPLIPHEVEAIGRQLKAEGVQAVAVSLLHSYVNSAHEEETGEILSRCLGSDVPVMLSSRILPEIREYERTSTAVVSAYVAPAVARYLSRLEDRLVAAGIRAPLRIVQSSGGAMSRENAIASPAHLLESGPAAGVIASTRTLARAGIADAISFDMGGTTAKAAMIENGVPVRTQEYEVGAGINLSSQLVKGGGYSIKLPFIDISEIGAGGGSIVTLSPEGRLRVGPESAGAWPGPACYGHGSDRPTFTDAMVVLGYVSPDVIAGGKVKIHADLARKAIAQTVAAPLGLGVEEAAFGIHKLAVAAMTRAVKAVTTYRGRDPRDFALFAFGGNGPVAATAVAAELGMARVLIPPSPGVFSAFGLPLTGIEHEMTRSLMRPCVEANAPLFQETLDVLRADAMRALARDGVSPADCLLVAMADMRFKGQAYELTIPLSGEGRDERIGARALREAFAAEHRRTFGHGSAEDAMVVVNLRVQGRGRAQVPERFLWEPEASASGQRTRPAWFGGRDGFVETPVIGRRALEREPLEGPLIVEEYDATCVVPPGCVAALDASGNIVIEVRNGKS